MGDQSMDDAMVVIQEASAIVKVSQQLSGKDGEALKDLSNRISNLESKAPQQKATATKVPFYINVTYF